MLATGTSMVQTSPFRPTFAGEKNNTYDTKKKQLGELVHYATLAPSSHNTQCWKFQIKPGRDKDSFDMITVHPDWERSCPVVDPDNHHLYVSLGCAVENLVWAAKAQGYRAIDVDSTCPSKGIHIKLSDPGTPQVTEMFEAIPNRQVSRCEYDSKPLLQVELDQLEEAAMGDAVRVILVTDRGEIDSILEHVLFANSVQMNNPEFKKELGEWVRFNEKEAIGRGDGLYGKCCGNPAASSMIGKLIFNLMARPSVENAKIIKQVKSSAGFAVFVSKKNDAEHWVEAGRAMKDLL